MPSRILKESICCSDTLEGLNSFQENMFYRLIVNCDDYGRFDARPQILKSRLYPLKDLRMEQITSALQALSSAGLVILYEVEGRPFVQMTTWERHQQIRAKKSRYPAPIIEKGHPSPGEKSSDINCNQLKSDDCKCPRNPIQSNPMRNAETRARPLLTDEEMDQAAEVSSTTSNRLWEAMEAAGMNMAATVRDSMHALVATYGIDDVIAAIHKASISDTRGGVSAAYVQSILANSGRKEERSPQPTDEQLTKKRREEAATLALLRGELPD